MTDTHLHTWFSPDSVADMSDMCKAATNNGISVVCFTEHIDLGHPERELAVYPNYPKYLQKIYEVRQQFPELTILTGLEVGDFVPARVQTKSFLEQYVMDFHLLSLHLIDGIDPYLPQFFENKTQNLAYTMYAHAVLESVTNYGSFDSLAHFGYVSKFAPYSPDIIAYSYRHAPDVNDEVLKRVAFSGAALEVNTSGYNRGKQPIPGPDIIRRFAEVGGEYVTFGSDAHTPHRVGENIKKASELVLACGIRYGVVFRGHKPMPYSLQ